MAEELGAAVAGAVLDVDFRPGVKNGIAMATLVGFDEKTISVFDVLRSHGSGYSPFLRKMMDRVSPERDSLTTASDADVISRRDWASSSWVAEYVSPARLDHFMVSSRTLDEPRCVDALGFIREDGDRAFTDEDRGVLHLLRLGCPRFFTSPATTIRLAPRVQSTLAYVLDGYADKEIAHALALSPHTVREYVKTIFRAYRVSSRAQLIARLRVT